MKQRSVLAKNILIDSDVILDFFLERDPFCDDVSIVLSMCENKMINGFVTPLIMSNVYYLLRKVGKRETVVEKLKTFISFIDIIDVNKEIVIRALHSDFTDFEDALQNYAAEYAKKISFIVTRNTKDYQQSELSVVTPSDFLKTM